MKTPLFYVGTLDRIRNSGYKFNHTKEVMIIFQFNERFIARKPYTKHCIIIHQSEPVLVRIIFRIIYTLAYI